MKQITLPLTTLFLVPLFVSANYYVSDYDPDYVPYNLQEVIDSREYDSCIDELREFDETYEQYLDLYGTPVSVGETLDIEFGALKEASEEEFRQCLILLRSEIQEESVEDCDFEVIDALSREEERSYRSEIRTCENLRALENCDFSYLEEMEGIEKFKYRIEIDKCEATLETEVQDEPPEEVEKPEPLPIQEEVVAEQKPVYVPPPEPVYEPAQPTVLTPEPVTESIPPVEDAELPETAASSSDVKTFEMTQEEIDALVAERLAEESSRKEQAIENKESVKYFV